MNQKKIIFLLSIILGTTFAAFSLSADANKDLLDAAWKADLIKIKSAISKGASPNTKDEFGKTPLHYTVTSTKTEVTKYLLEKGANINAKDKDGETPLMTAAWIEVVNLLLEKGADVKAKDNEDRDAVIYHSDRSTTSLDIIKALEAKGASLKVKGKNGKTPLMLACKNDSVDIIHYLLDKGLDVTAKDSEGTTVLMYAASGPSAPELIELLLKKGADKKVKNEAGKTAFDLAKSERTATFEPYIKYKEEVMKLLK
ncbi:hypothetical protein CH373_09250 [Leptospira perolatii]|uniref:Uncharacterized protein n=1 Tax=Leptospira perolatii TaxID=2023191 RepID=A0A2M9ZNK9_9LEPT|nr:ankyrin repeat domain-containing protein [Leptospira perolatii]PJZ69673.1 hypothetical protein CH360_10395 [Leptospira perolatii]PJZ73660.1 hypothetical protein CH373_09250 [Leptospira perolatii]